MSHSLRDTCSSDEGCETVGLCTERDNMRGEWYRGRFRALKIQPEKECGMHACRVGWGGGAGSAVGQNMKEYRQLGFRMKRVETFNSTCFYSQTMC